MTSENAGSRFVSSKDGKYILTYWSSKGSGRHQKGQARKHFRESCELVNINNDMAYSRQFNLDISAQAARPPSVIRTLCCEAAPVTDMTWPL